MGADSKIEWCSHTLNPWVGCQKISDACTNCYAESWAKRTGQAGLWRGERRRTSATNWRQPLKWDRAAAEEEKNTGKASTVRVFCASLADVFENHPAIDPQWRVDLWELIAGTPFLTWLLLTKRPENVLGMVPPHWREGRWPARVWLGTTVEHQAAANERVPHLLRCPAPVRFLSMEPLLGPVVLNSEWLPSRREPPLYSKRIARERNGWAGNGLSWLIVGGESGGNARPSHPDWYRALRDQCLASVGIPFLFKQHGALLAECQATNDAQRVRPVEHPSPHNPEKVNTYYRPGKHAAGRLLDGVEWSQFPAVPS